MIDEQIFDRLRQELANAPDFRGEPKARFEQLIFRLIRYHGDRANALAARYPYLGAFSAPSDARLEGALQQDLYDYLLSAGYGAKVEVSDIAAGRSDIYIHFGQFSFVIECKRLFDEWSDEAIRPFVDNHHLSDRQSPAQLTGVAKSADRFAHRIDQGDILGITAGAVPFLGSAQR